MGSGSTESHFLTRFYRTTITLTSISKSDPSNIFGESPLEAGSAVLLAGDFSDDQPGPVDRRLNGPCYKCVEGITIHICELEN